MRDSSPTSTSMRTFFIVWFGQFISLIGSNMTAFGLAIWVFERTGSVTQYGFTILFTLVPLSLAAPIAGTLIDRWDRRKVMIYADLVAGLDTIVVAALLFSGQLEVWHIYVAAIVNSVANAFQNPSYQATITAMVPKSQYGRVAGLLQLGEALAFMTGPLLAILLIEVIEIHGIILIDLTTFMFAMFTLLMVRIPQPHIERRAAQAPTSIRKDMRLGAQYIVNLRGLVGLTVFVVFFLQMILGIAQTVLLPMVLTFADPPSLIFVIGGVGIGALLGGIILAAWGGPRNRVRGIFLFSIPYGIGLMIAGLRADVFVIGLGGFTFAISHAMLTGFNRALWQAKIPVDYQGRVFSMRMLVGVTAQSVGTGLAGPLADYVFEPLMSRGAVLPTYLFENMINRGNAIAQSFGPMIGLGVGRGIGLMYLLLGFTVIVTTVIAFMNPGIRGFERNVPDAILDEEDYGEDHSKEAAKLAMVEEDNEPEPESPLA